MHVHVSDNSEVHLTMHHMHPDRSEVSECVVHVHMYCTSHRYHVGRQPHNCVTKIRSLYHLLYRLPCDLHLGILCTMYMYTNHTPSIPIILWIPVAQIEQAPNLVQCNVKYTAL